MSTTTSRPALLLALALLLLQPGCANGLRETVGSIFGEPVSMETEGSDLPTLAAPARSYQHPDLENADGSVTRVLWLPPGIWKSTLEPLVKNHPDGAQVTTTLAEKAMTDPIVAPNNKKWEEKQASGNDAVMVTGPVEEVDAVCGLIDHIITSVPKIEIEARVVEVLETDEFAWGVDWFLLDRGDHEFDPQDPAAPLTPSKTLFNRAFIGRGIPPLPGFTPGGFVPDVLVNLGTIQQDIQIDLLISALEMFTKVDIVNAPRILVLSGHTAVLSAGQEVPFFELNVSGNNTAVSTTFKKIAVNLEVIPRLIGDDTVRLVVYTSVDNISAFSTVVSAGVQVTNPIITTRSASTTLDVQNGATVVLGGLITTGKVNVEDKVPVLGDVPILDILFSNRHQQDQRSNLIFFIRPKLITPSGESKSGLILPPEPGEMSEPPGDGD